jgi:hypothetical protein
VCIRMMTCASFFLRAAAGVCQLLFVCVRHVPVVFVNTRLL